MEEFVKYAKWKQLTLRVAQDGAPMFGSAKMDMRTHVTSVDPSLTCQRDSRNISEMSTKWSCL